MDLLRGPAEAVIAASVAAMCGLSMWYIPGRHEVGTLMPCSHR